MPPKQQPKKKNTIQALATRQQTGKFPKYMKAILKSPEFTPLPSEAARHVVNWDDEIEAMIQRFERRTGLSRYPS